jgi:hypothetical protein
MPRDSLSDGSCIQTVRDSKPKIEERGRKAIFLNPKRDEVKIVRVDGCLVTDTSRRADYIVSKPAVIDVIVELKGKDIFHARDQIMATLLVWRSHPPFSTRIAGLIVCSRSPASSSDLQVMKRKARTEGIAMLIEESGRREYGFDVFG